MEERFLKGLAVFVVVIFAIIALCAMWTEHEKFLLLKEAIHSGNYAVTESNCK